MLWIRMNHLKSFVAHPHKNVYRFQRKKELKRKLTEGA